MKSKKFFKTTMTSFAILGGTSLCTSALVSCGKKNTPPPSKQTWDQFVSKAEAETLSNIVNNANPAAGSWKNLPDNDLTTDGDFVVNKPTITIKIKSISMKAEASFSISAPDDNIYKVGNWGCSKQPPPPSNEWNIFKTAAIAETSAKLLTQAQTTDAYKAFHWIGSSAQQTWQTGQIAEFDVYGGNGGSDTYKGMSGEPVVSEANHTITAIISIADGNKRGNYDADPIQAVITDKGSAYELSDWVFSQTQQLQSQQKYLAWFGKSIGDMPNVQTDMKANSLTWTHFADNNYISNKDSNHISINSVTAYLYKNGWPGLIKSDLDTYTQLDPDNNNRLKSVLTISLWTIDNARANYTMKLTSYFNFKDNSNQNVGSAFNFNWHADITTTSENV